MTPSFSNTVERLRRLKDYYGAQPNAQSRYHFFACETPESIAVVEQKTGMPVPPDLKELLLTAGGLSLSIDVDGFVLTYHNRSPYPRPFGGLVELLDARWCWDDYRDSGDFPESDMARMNADYVSFGHCEVDQNSADHFFYDRNGDFFVLHFDQEFRDDDANNYMYELAEGKNSHAPMTLEEMLTPYLEEHVL